uniref:Uncharacterized protein LOC111138158 isoform X3 n=1 Tax=Crassostrea virginica TaxID=6565 RepID=A0A8B8F0B9_CRAVI|nr:uncharacterized protein LOC111138158 isoform X3 [Crassostrea virginica]
MFNVTSGCPNDNWRAVARASCDTADQFHYLRDEHGNIGWVCAVPIWVEKENYCRYPCNHESSTVMPTIFQNEGNHKLIPYIMGLLILLILFVVLATLAIYVYFRKRKSVQKGDEHELENASPSMGNKNDEFSDEFRQLVDGEIEKTNEVDASRYRGNNNSNMQLLEFNNVTNANSKHQITEPKERQNGIFNKEDQLNGPSMAAKDFSKDDDIVVINCIEEVSNTNNT